MDSSDSLARALERITELEIKASYAEDSVDQLNMSIYRQQQQIDALRTRCGTAPSRAVLGQDSERHPGGVVIRTRTSSAEGDGAPRSRTENQAPRPTPPADTAAEVDAALDPLEKLRLRPG